MRTRNARSNLSPQGLFWVLQVSVWLAYTATMVVWGLELWPAGQALAYKAILGVLGFGLTLLARQTYRLTLAKGVSHLVFLVQLLVTSIVGAAVWREAALLCVLAVAGRSTAQLVAIPFGTWVYDSLVLVAWSLAYWGLGSWLELDAARGRAQRAEAELLRARRQALRAQLEPHFLFNTLNAIATLVDVGDRGAALRTISSLSEFLRLTLERSEVDTIELGAELSLARRYLEIERIRFGDRLQVEIHADSAASCCQVPVLILQPLIENAVRHGVQAREGTTSIVIDARRTGDRLRLVVRDDGPGLAAGHFAGHGIGLGNTAGRLEALYGSRAGLRIGEAAGRGFETVLDLPAVGEDVGGAPALLVAVEDHG